MDKKNENAMRKPRVIIWGGWYGSRNIGDRLLLITITDILKEYLGVFNLTILSAKPDIVKEYFTWPENKECKIINSRKQPLDLIQAIIGTDLMIIGGGAPFFDQYNQAILLTMFVLLLKFFKKPYFIWSVFSYQINHKINRLLFKFVINNAVKVTVRDQYTSDIFIDLGAREVPEITQDSAFSLSNIDTQDADRLLKKYLPDYARKKLFALTPRTLRLKDTEAQTHYNEKTNAEVQHQFAVYSIALEWLVENGYTPVFIPMNTNAPDDDRIVSKEIMANSKYSKNVILIDEMVMPKTAPALFANCEGSLVSRVHGSVTSFLGTCPPMIYAFEKKHKGIMESMGLEKMIFETSQQPDQIINLLKAYQKDQQFYRDLVFQRKEDLAAKSRIPYRYIANYLEKKAN